MSRIWIIAKCLSTRSNLFVNILLRDTHWLESTSHTYAARRCILILLSNTFYRRNVLCYNAGNIVETFLTWMHARWTHIMNLQEVIGSIYGILSRCFSRNRKSWGCIINSIADFIMVAIAAISILIGESNTISDYVVKRLTSHLRPAVRKMVD